MTSEENIQIEVRSSSSKLESNFLNETVSKNPSANFAVVYLDNSKPHDDTTVSLCCSFLVFLYIAIGLLSRKPNSKGI